MFILENVAFDLDDTSLDFIPQFINFHNCVYGTSLKEEDFTTYDLVEVCGYPKVEVYKRMSEFYNSDFFKQVTPVNGARRIMQFLKEILDKRKMIVVTGRGTYLEEMTTQYVKDHFNGFFSGIYHAVSYGPSEANKPKSEICLEHNVNLIFEDDPKHIISCVNAGIKVIVRNRPWNRDPLPDGAFRMKSFYEVPRILYEISNKR